MAITKRLLDHARTAGATRDVEEIRRRTPEDRNRASLEALVRGTQGDARSLKSSGQLRLHGDGVEGHSVNLSTFAALGQSWQKAVTAIGAALEGVESGRGKLPATITNRTTVQLDGAPAPGSVLMNIRPKSDPLEETDQDNTPRVIDGVRPLVDRASSDLIDLLQKLVASGLETDEDVAGELRSRGPRVNAALAQFTKALASESVAVDTMWSEPDHPTRRTQVSAQAARRIHQLIMSRDVYSDVKTLIGVARTVSDRQKWVIELDDESEVRMDATQLNDAVVQRVTVGQRLNLRVDVEEKVRPDGRVDRAYKILEVLDR